MMKSDTKTQLTGWIFFCWIVLSNPACKQTTAPAESSKKPQTVESVLLWKLPGKPDFSAYADKVQTLLEAAYQSLQNQQTPAHELVKASQLLHAHRQENLALFGYLNAVKQDPQRFEWWYLAGVAAKSIGEDRCATVCFSKAMALNPNYQPAAVEWAEYELQAGRFDSAKAVFQKVLSQDANHVMAHWGMGQLAQLNGSWPTALGHFKRVLALDPKATMVYYPLSQAQQALGDLEGAKHSLSLRGEGRPSMPDTLMEEVLALEMTVSGFRRAGDAELRAGAYQNALEYYQQALDLDESDASTYLNRGWAYYLSQKSQAAVADWQKAIELSQDKPLLQAQAYYCLGQVNQASGQSQQAISHFREALARHDEFFGAKLALAETLRSVGQFERAGTYYQELVEKKPGDPVPRLGRALCLIRLGQYLKAKQALDTDIAAQPKQATFYHMQIRLLASAPEPMVRDGRRAFSMMEQLTQGWRILDSGLSETAAMVLAETGKYEEAVRMQQRALSLAAQEGSAQQLRPRLLENLNLYVGQQACRKPWPDDAPIFTQQSLSPEPLLETAETQQ